jgi:murein DD-endopeptidase MepM/ murein hydrolase activator NlpD
MSFNYKKFTLRSSCRNILAAALALCVMLTPMFASADSYDDKINNAKDDKIQLESDKNEIKDLASQKQNELSSISSQIAQLEADRITMMTSEEMAISELEFIKQSILDSETEIEKMQKTLDELEKELVERARTMYQNAELDPLAMFLEADNIFDFFNRLEAYKQVVKEDSKLLSQVKTDRYQLELKKEQQERLFSEKEVLLEEIEQAIKDINNHTAIEENKYANLSKLLSDLEAEEDRLDDKISNINGDIAEWEKQKAAEAERKRQEEEAKKNQQNSSNSVSRDESAANFCWPLASYYYVSSPFGYRNHPITHKWSLHTGVDLAASGGTAIYAAQSGVVEVSTTNGGGFGYYIKIQHDNGLETMYAHCSKLLVKEGETVQRGQKIAEVGKTGSATGCHLHFEVIKNGQYVQPLNYISDTRH